MKKSTTWKSVNIERKTVNFNDYISIIENDNFNDTLIEEAKKIPVAYDMDIVVVGSGIAGLFAAISAARLGASTLLIEKLSSLGGNIGPGMYHGGRLVLEGTIAGEIASIPKEFHDEMLDLCKNDCNYGEESTMVSYLGIKMCEEAGVEMLLNSFSSDVIVENGVVKGLFVETISGRIAVKSKVIIDATGEASVAKRAGAKVIPHMEVTEDMKCLLDAKRAASEYKWYNDTGMTYFVDGIDFDKVFSLDSKKINMLTKTSLFKLRRSGKTLGRLTRNINGQFESDNAYQMTIIENILRTSIVEDVEEMKRNIPGFENAYIVNISQYLGARGGTCIEGKHMLTLKESWEGKKFDDVMFIDTFRRPSAKPGYNQRGCEVPYAILVPKDLKGMLVTGRGASYERRGHDGPGIRPRVSMMSLGESTGAAAALSVLNNVLPSELDVLLLQRYMFDSGYYLGKHERLKQIGLI